MSTRIKHFAHANRHISRVRLANFACSAAPLSERESAHFDTCKKCRLALLELMRNMVVTVFECAKPAAA
jgi:hypothetical protein